MRNVFKIVVVLNIFMTVFMTAQDKELIFESKYGSEKYKYIKFNYCDSVFQYNGVLCKGKNGITYTAKDNIITNVFKIENGVWFFKNKNTWNTFFDENNLNEFLKITINDLSYQLKWKKIPNQYGLTNVFRLELNPIGFSQNHLNSYIFTPKLGFVIIATHRGDIYRKNLFSSHSSGSTQ